MNALLKILEEPTEGIYAIFTTKNHQPYFTNDYI